MKEENMSLCIMHNPKPTEYASVPNNECVTCIKNAFDPKKCMICRENDGHQIADGFVICKVCEDMYL